MTLEQIKKAISLKPLARFENRKSIFLILLVFAVFFFPWLIAGKTLYPIAEGRSIQFFNDEPSVKRAIFNPAYLDHGATDWIESPINESVNHAIWEGEWPLWNPYNSMGMPVLANTNGATVAPLGFFLNFVNSEAAWNAMYIGRLFFAVIFTFYFLRKLGLGQIASVSGALLFGFSGYAQLHLNMFHFHVDAMLPFLFWATLSYVQERSRSSWLLLLAAIIGMILGGNPQNLILSCAVSSLFFVTLSLVEKTDKDYRYWLYYFLAFVVAIGCCSFYEASFYELFQRALKYHEGMGLFSLPVVSLLGLSFPVFFSSPGLGAVYLPYLGLLTIPVIAAGLRFTGQFRLVTWFFFATSLFFILKVVGFPLLNWIGGLPVLDNILFTKYLSPLYFAVSVLFALAIHELLKGNGAVRFYFAVLISSALLIVTYKQIFHAQYAEKFVIYWLLVFMLLAASALLLASRFTEKNKGFAFAILICILCELFFNRTYHLKDTLASGVAFSTPKFIKFIRSDREHDYDRVFGVGKILMGNQASLFQIHDIRGLSATTDNRYYTFMRDLVLGQNLDLHPFITTSSTYHAEGRPILNLLGVRYIIFDDCKPHQLEAATLVHQELCMEVYKNSAAFDRAFVVHDYLEVDNDAKILEAMGSGKVDLSKTVLLNKGSHVDLLKRDNESGTTSGEVAIIDSYRTNDVSVDVNMKSSGILVLSDLFYPGWHVYVDGKSKELLTVDYALRGVVLEAGQHKVHFSYESPVLKYGIAVSVAFLVLALLLYIFFPLKNIARAIKPPIDSSGNANE